MSDIIKLENIQKLIFTLRDQQIIIDSDVAALYGVETKGSDKEYFEFWSKLSKSSFNKVIFSLIPRLI